MLIRTEIRRGLELALALAAGWLAVAAPTTPVRHHLEVVRAARPGMGSVFQVTVAARHRSRADLTRAVEAALDEVERLEAQLSEWREGTDVSEVNSRAGGAPVRVSAETFATLESAQWCSQVSSGAFDVTFNALHGLWDFKAARPRLPDPAEVARRVALIDHTKLRLDPVARTAQLETRGMKIGLGGIGQGIAVDRVCRVLEAAGLPDHLVDGSGDVKVCGSRGDAPWTVGVRHPRREALLCMVEAAGHAIVTSGDYERFFVVDGRRYHHIIDPRTGYPARGAVSATVVAGTATEADALATAALVMGPVRGLAMLERLPGVEGLIVDDELRSHMTRGLEVRGAADEVPVLALSRKAGAR